MRRGRRGVEGRGARKRGWGALESEGAARRGAEESNGEANVEAGQRDQGTREEERVWQQVGWPGWTRHQAKISHAGRGESAAAVVVHCNSPAVKLLAPKLVELQQGEAGIVSVVFSAWGIDRSSRRIDHCQHVR